MQKSNLNFVEDAIYVNYENGSLADVACSGAISVDSTLMEDMTDMTVSIVESISPALQADNIKYDRNDRFII